jgi:hypothetical protein
MRAFLSLAKLLRPAFAYSRIRLGTRNQSRSGVRDGQNSRGASCQEVDEHGPGKTQSSKGQSDTNSLSG